jgi:hypothetical protein
MKSSVKIVLTSMLLASAPLAFASTTLKGNFTADNETALMKQLTPQGFEYFNSYQHNPDGSTVIKALDTKGEMEPIATINISKEGLAIASETDMNLHGATAHN